jgi:hypothetical protein
VLAFNAEGEFVGSFSDDPRIAGVRTATADRLGENAIAPVRCQRNSERK